jgi:hypothetical protein
VAAPSPLAHRPAPVRSAYERAAAHGHPIAILTRSTVLRASPGGRGVARLPKQTEWRSPQVLAAVAQRGPWLKVIATQLPNGRRGWIPASAAQVRSDPWAIRVRLATRHLEVLKNGRVVRRVEVTIGGPSTPTPTGRFAVTDRIRWVGRGSDYGCCTLALSGHQPHVPPGWAGGDRLAIHSTDTPQTLGVAASNGCLRTTDADARWLIMHVYLGTIVEVRP